MTATAPKYLAGCTETLARTAMAKFRDTGIRHDVIHVAGRGRQFVAVSPCRDGRYGEYETRGNITVLYVANGGKTLVVDGMILEN